VENLNNSFARAIKLLKTADNDEEYISIKIKPANGGCCCFHCWPHTWNEINNKIARYGVLKDEGDLAIGDGNERFVLECHESGPEIVVYLGIGIASANLAKAIIDLVLALIKNRQREKDGSQFVITKRIIINSIIIEENVIKIDFPLSKENIDLLNKKLNGIF
jgi:hypothetical protein